MKRATFVFKNEYREDEETFEGESWVEIFEAFNESQNIDCLIRHSAMGSKKDRATLAALSEFVERWREDQVEKADFAAFDCKLSIGSFRCISCEDEDGAVSFAS